jgi:6-phosphogluconolactonase
MTFHAFDTRDALMRAAADRIGEALSAGVAAHGTACAALSGGSTPEPAYALLAEAALDWPTITFALVDERFVPPDHPASNEALVRRALAPAFARGAQFAPMWSAAASASEAAARADARYAGLRIDVALMGMGADAHTASWFPGVAGEALDPTNPRTVIAVHAPGAAGAAHRLTLTRSALARVGRTLLLITGADKRARLEAALAEPPDQAPVRALYLDGAPDTLWAA